MQLIPRDEAKKFSFDWREEAQLSVRPGETFEIETWDGSSFDALPLRSKTSSLPHASVRQYGCHHASAPFHN